jgi:hypothetical protein
METFDLFLIEIPTPLLQLLLHGDNFCYLMMYQTLYKKNACPF